MHNWLYLLIAGVISILLFLYGFFPIKICDGLISTKHDLPTLIEDVELNVSSLYPQVIDRLVIMVIDAMRLDFIDGIDGVANMPYTSTVLANKKAIKVTGKADPPTVTMPRIKALTSGTVPNFVDFLLNFGSSEILEDNLITQAASKNWKMVFYGDNTWLKLFPNRFIRSDGTTSFFVSDFKEVDDNVTRHLKSELDATDWKIMVLHYLGLDHIGHSDGPKSPQVQPKLQEMDNIVKTIHTRLVATDEVLSTSSLFIVCGDHGMKDTGSHGGATLAEVLVPIIMIGQVGSNEFDSLPIAKDLIVPQIDLVPTLSVLLGLPIPSGNLGKMIPQLLGKLPAPQQLYALHYNCKQVAKQYASDSRQASEHLQTYENAVATHAKWLRTDMPEALFVRATALYTKALEGMSSELSEARVTFDLYAMACSIAVLVQICFVFLMIIFQSYTRTQSTLRLIVIISIFTVGVFLLNKMYCSWSMCKSVLCQKTTLASMLALLVAFVLTYNACLIASFRLPSRKAVFDVFNADWRRLCLVLGTVLHVASLASSSFIEEEHQVWYFLWISLAFVVLYDLIAAGSAELAWQWFFIMSLHRLLRKWNQTGDKWASLPDIGDWLKQPEQKYQLSFILFLGVCGIYACCEFISAKCQSVTQSTRFRYRILWALAAFYLYCFRGATGIVFMPFNYPTSRGIVEVHIFWCILSIQLFLGVVIPIYQFKMNRSNPIHVSCEVVGCLLIVWMFLCGVVHRAHDVVLIPVQMFVSMIALRTLQGLDDVMTITGVFTWLGSVFYCYQGNSNSLASVDVASGYVGQEEYSAVKVGLLLLANTYCAHVLAHLLLVTTVLQHLQSTNSLALVKTRLNDVNRTAVMMRILPISVYVLLVTFQRYHLFVWTVFSPKLLYESMHTIVTLMIMVILKSVFKLVEITEEKCIGTK